MLKLSVYEHCGGMCRLVVLKIMLGGLGTRVANSWYNRSSFEGDEDIYYYNILVSHFKMLSQMF